MKSICGDLTSWMQVSLLLAVLLPAGCAGNPSSEERVILTAFWPEPATCFSGHYIKISADGAVHYSATYRAPDPVGGAAGGRELAARDYRLDDAAFADVINLTKTFHLYHERISLADDKRVGELERDFRSVDAGDLDALRGILSQKLAIAWATFPNDPASCKRKPPVAGQIWLDQAYGTNGVGSI